MDPSPERSALRKISIRILPLLFILYLSAFIDRVNLGFAAISLRADLNLNATQFGWGAGIFFIGYCIFEIPSNLILERTGARMWIARIMFTWAIVSASTMFVRTAPQLYLCRFLLGVAEAGFFPGMILYLTYWFPAAERARAISYFMLASPLASVVGQPVSATILKYVPGFAASHLSAASRLATLKGWQWLYLLEALPSLLMTVVVLLYLTDKPSQAKWLTTAERASIENILEKERRSNTHNHRINLLEALFHPRVWMLTMLYFTMNLGNYGLDFWLPTILKDFKGLDTSRPNIYYMIPYTAAAIGMLVVGWHSDKTGERNKHIFWPCLVSAIAMLGFAAFVGKSPVGALVCITIAAVGPRAILGPIWTLPPVFLTGSALAGSIALINSIGNLGGTIGPWMLGRLKDKTHSFVPGIVMLASAILITGLLGLATRIPVKPNAAAEPAETLA